MTRHAATARRTASGRYGWSCPCGAFDTDFATKVDAAAWADYHTVRAAEHDPRHDFIGARDRDIAWRGYLTREDFDKQYDSIFGTTDVSEKE